MSNTSPTAVSTRLRKARFAMAATRKHEGVRVSRGALAGQVSVSVDYDKDRDGTIIADALAEELATWDGYTFARTGMHFTVVKSDAAPAAAPTAPAHDIRAAWQFIVDSYDGGYSPIRADWTDADILGFVEEHHVDGIDAFKLQHPTGEGISPAPAGFDPAALLGAVRDAAADRAELVKIITEHTNLSRNDADHVAGIMTHAGFARRR